eukprot:TRINITY_DN9722_c0_g1_i1.p1 TRINITY_DN9722_c0_g1~~TRINITY_DN9722_c0_g1_i1.p1  ORF type:complete len:190 (+),score=39.25 TRINITY_DN9722_c0_g1_i1:507-1076(+)
MQWVPQSEQPRAKEDEMEGVDQAALGDLVAGLRRELALKKEMVTKLRDMVGEVDWDPVCKPSTDGGSTRDGDEDDMDAFLDELPGGAPPGTEPDIDDFLTDLAQTPQPPSYPPGSLAQARHGHPTYVDCTIQSVSNRRPYTYTIRWASGGISSNVPESELRPRPRPVPKTTSPSPRRYQLPDFETVPIT